MSRHLFIRMVLISLLSVAYCTISAAAVAQARVVASIKPLQAIASAITDGISEPAVLIPSNQSYHHFTLRPSTIRSLRQADLFVWVGPELETYLSDTVLQASRRQQVIQVLSLTDLRVHHMQGDGEDGAEILIPDEGEHAGHRHKTGNAIDPHVWLDTHNAGLIASAITQELARIDSAHATEYQANLDQFLVSLSGLSADIRGRIRMPPGGSYAVYHNAFQYFENEFGLGHDLVFVESEELQPSVRHMLAVRRAIESRPLMCLMEDVTTQPATVQTMLGDQQVSRVQADTTGQWLDNDPAAYLRLIEGLADAFSECFEVR